MPRAFDNLCSPPLDRIVVYSSLPSLSPILFYFHEPLFSHSFSLCIPGHLYPLPLPATSSWKFPALRPLVSLLPYYVVLTSRFGSWCPLRIFSFVSISFFVTARPPCPAPPSSLPFPSFSAHSHLSSYLRLIPYFLYLSPFLHPSCFLANLLCSLGITFVIFCDTLSELFLSYHFF